MIIGMTDRAVFRRTGKIRAGKKEKTASGKEVPKNFPHFLLHDAQQLIPALGEDPKEIYFTVHSDMPQEFFRPDLRWYTASQLNCVSMHNAPDENNQRMGAVAAYYVVGGNHSGVRQQQFPNIQRARVRNCAIKACPQYVSGDCGEHMFLDVLIPQCSMGMLFTLDSTSVNAILNAHSTFGMAYGQYAGKLSGQIFRMFKREEDMNYFDERTGKTGKRKGWVVAFEGVKFSEYESKFREKIAPEDWEALAYLRNRQYMPVQMISGPTAEALELPTGPEVAQIQAPQKSDEELVRERANDPVAMTYFDKYAALVGRENTEGVRMATAANFASVEKLVAYLQTKIAAAKKTAAPQETANQTPPPQNDPPPQAGSEAPVY